MVIEEIRLRKTARFIDFDLEKNKELLEIVDLASAVTNCPFAIISFFDQDTQYLKVKKGINETTIPRHLSLCREVVEQTELITVSDTFSGSGFIDNPLVTGKHGIRFFASMPLLTQEGQILGTLCVLNVIPHNLNGHQQLVLKILGNQVMKIVELMAETQLLAKNQQELELQKQLTNDANTRLRSFFESSTNFHVLLDKAGEVIDYNKTAFNFIRAVHKTELKRGDRFTNYLHPEFVGTFLIKYNEALEGKRSLVEGSTDYEELGIIWWEAAFEAARDADNHIIGISYLIRNVTERKLKEQKILSQNASLLKIAHIHTHEFRGPLATIMGLMNLIKEDSYNPPAEYLKHLEQAVDNLDTTIRHIVSNIESNVINSYAVDLQ